MFGNHQEPIYLPISKYFVFFVTYFGSFCIAFWPIYTENVRLMSIAVIRFYCHFKDRIFTLFPSFSFSTSANKAQVSIFDHRCDLI